MAGRAAPAERQPAREAVRSAGPRLSVLPVDDEELVRTATAEMIRDLGHHVEEARGAVEALARLDDGLAVDLVMTDYMMSGMNDGALARRIDKSHPELPIRLITGYTGATDDVLHLPRLAKPFGQADIAQAIEGLLAGDPKVVRFARRKPKR